VRSVYARLAGIRTLKPPNSRRLSTRGLSPSSNWCRSFAATAVAEVAAEVVTAAEAACAAAAAAASGYSAVAAASAEAVVTEAAA
jgi:hypothetical protein